MTVYQLMAKSSADNFIVSLKTVIPTKVGTHAEHALALN
jgi:hypothetical protein